MSRIIERTAQLLGLRDPKEKVMRLDAGRRRLVMPYLEIEEAAAPGEPLIIGIHGYGASERQMETLVNLAPAGPYTYIAPRALYLHPTGGHMWFPIAQGDGGAVSFETEKVIETLDRIDSFIEAAIERYAADPQRVIFVGYSQGGMLAFPYLLRHPNRIAAAVALSGSFGGDPTVWQQGQSVAGKGLFIGYGTKDPLILPDEMTAARQTFSEMGADVTYREYAIPHVVSQAEVADVEAWLASYLARR